MTQKREHGTLSGVSRTRKIDTWKFNASSSGISTNMEFDVYINPDLSFRVETKAISPQRYEPLEGKDLSLLHERAQEAARQEFDLRNSLTWSDWLEVRVTTMAKHDLKGVVSGSQARVIYRVIPRAQSSDGQVYTVNNNNVLTRFPQDTSVADLNEDGWASREIASSHKQEIEGRTPPNSAERLSALLTAHDNRDPSTQFSYIPDTPENRAGLNTIIEVIEQANQKLQDFLASSNITQTLERARSSAGNLLSGPAPDSKKSRPSGP